MIGSRTSVALALVMALGLLTRCTERDDVVGAAAADASIDASVEAATTPDAGWAPCQDAEHQAELRCTGLYADITAKAVAADVLAFGPAFPLWSDGAAKSRWIRLPPGGQIDTTDMNEWRFPSGTKFWKEFSVGGHRIETRLIEKKPDGKWLRQAFKWSDDETVATELPNGELNVRGTGYDIPPEAACAYCHEGRIDGVLGFEAVSLAGGGATGLTLAELVARGLITKAPTAPIVVPGNATERGALTWLHANCGTACHNANPTARANFTYLFLRLNVGQLGSVAATDIYTNSVKVVSGFQPDVGDVLFRIQPANPSRSVMFRRASVRDARKEIQMPPLATNVVDDAGLESLRGWILSLPP